MVETITFVGIYRGIESEARILGWCRISSNHTTIGWLRNPFATEIDGFQWSRSDLFHKVNYGCKGFSVDIGLNPHQFYEEGVLSCCDQTSF